MEQDEFVYEYRMGSAIFRFEAHHEHEAQQYRPYALLHFQDTLGQNFSESALQGPIRISLDHGMSVRA